jgi:hypothetical protein
MDGPIRWYMMPIKLPRTIARKPDGMNILVAIEPRAYREVIGETIGALRPQHKVTVVAPGSLRPALDRLGPEVVISGRSDGFMANGTLAWVEFRPYARPEARVSLRGLRRELAEVDLEDLLAVVDEAGALSGG